ncbi:MAG TPA: CsgG/HfaB family protein [Gemmatimonadaceae bacterium]|nr:CsgG/HfaB family protein [Gemmatimonadaceae bacterium]
MSRFARSAALSLALALPLAFPFQRARAQADSRPVVAILPFDNTSFGKDRAEFDGIGKGIADMIGTELASNPRLRVVDREQLQRVLEEQNLTRSGAVDAQTAARLGRIVGAQYMIKGSFTRDLRGRVLLTTTTIDVETTVLSNPNRVESDGEDILGTIAQLATRLSGNLKLAQRTVEPSAPAGESRQSGAAQSGEAKSAVAKDAEPVAKSAEPKVGGDKRVTRSEAGSSKKQPKMDVRTSLLYAKALDEQDRGNDQRATELYRAVLTRVPDYEPAKAKLAKLEKAKS